MRAKDAAGNVSGNSNTVTRKGDSGDTQAPTAPANLSFTEPASGQIKLAWTASSDNKGVTGYDIYANNVLRKSVAGDVTTYTDTQPAGTTVSYVVRARDAAGNVSGDSNTVTRNGSTGTAPTWPSASPSPPPPWCTPSSRRTPTTTSSPPTGRARAAATPNTLTVKLGANADTQSVVVKLNPDSSWGGQDPEHPGPRA